MGYNSGGLLYKRIQIGRFSLQIFVFFVPLWLRILTTENAEDTKPPKFNGAKSEKSNSCPSVVYDSEGLFGNKTTYHFILITL